MLEAMDDIQMPSYFGMLIFGSLEPLARPPNITAFCPTRLKVCPSLGQGGSPRGVSLLHSHLLANNSYSCNDIMITVIGHHNGYLIGISTILHHAPKY